MKFIHTADWHLGRSFHEKNLVEDQRAVLGQLVDLIREEKPDVVLVAGDIYDRSVPAVDAVCLLNDVLNEIVLQLKVPLAMIAGNHDSPGRLAFGSELYKDQGLSVAGPTTRKLVIKDRHGPVDIFLIPYARPEDALEAGLSLKERSHDAALAAQIQDCSGGKASKRSIIVAHAFVANCEESESERLLSVGGAGTVSADHFNGFGYTALGHLHRPQEIRDNVRYSGSLLKYSFSEVDHTKGVVVGEMDAKGKVSTRFVELSPSHEVRIVEGQFADLLKSTGTKSSKEDYIEFRLLDKGPVLNAMIRLRERYPNALSVRRPEVEMRGDSSMSGVDRRKVSHADLFERFFLDVVGEPMTVKEKTAFEEILNDIQAEEGVAS